MNWKTVLAILGGILGIICGEAVKVGLKDWVDFGRLDYWMGVGIQIAGLIAVYVGGVNTVPAWDGTERRNGGSK